LSDDNAVLYWNEQALNAIRLARTPPPVASIHLGSVHAAIHDTVSGITRMHKPWLEREFAPAGIDMDAAIAGAAHSVLAELFGASTNPQVLRSAFDRAVAGIPDGPARAAGLAYGRKIAAGVLAERAKSGWDKPAEGTFSSTKPGMWRETPPGFRPAVRPQHAKTKPFVMKSPDQFRAPPPPPIDSKKFAEELAEVARLGARDGSVRTEYETLSAPFWADDLGSATPPGHWNVIAQDLARRYRLDTPACARLFALLNLACADAGISVWDTKFHYSTWRPETALREITKEINPHAVAHPDFIPLMASPAFPSYTSGHSTFSGAASRLLERWFGTDDIEFTTTSDGLPGAVRTFKKLSAAREEVGMSRIWGGIHYMSDNTEGLIAGMKIADYVFENALGGVERKE
jgi:membrane-associated phospholipid phosphatase